ncbi:LysR family transcriptional regulator [Glaciimonas sp. PCH181]|uniref:LysR family transcriptional regulator n=1 Tax=Glaciimonas sp. PCH181 TaxID=2133943 RepID=UPI000D341D35|nr:LysR family transcriptional regulator [Glaciimonas sp. PCH181]PUA19875.1 LysR family transcriptional regulator [Glaciimonas sp. PCH181]
MQVFARVVDCESFSRAAKSLDLANATVTSNVRNLEKHLGVTLMQGNTRSLRLTDEGATYYERCVELLRGVEQAETEIKGQSGKVYGTLRIESPVAFAKALICPVLPAFAEKYPSLSITLALTDHPRSLIERETDVAIRIDHVDDVDLVARAIYRARYTVCGSPSLFASLKVPGSPRELDSKLCLGLLIPETFVARTWEFSCGDEQYNVRPEGQLNYNSSDALIQAALEGKGLIYISDVFVNRLISSGALVVMFPEWDTTSRTFYVVTPQARFIAPKARAFTEFLLDILDIQKRPNANSPIAVRSAVHRIYTEKQKPTVQNGVSA